MSSLKDKVAICTGSGRKDGLGAAILRRFAADGCKLVVTDLGESSGLLSDSDIGASAGMEEVSAARR